MTIALSDSARCPCSSGETYGQCCGSFHSGSSGAPTAERLMRSRFSAFAVGDSEYLLATWHPSTRPHDMQLDAARSWYRLDILATARGGPFDTDGTVMFEAFYRHPDVNGSQVEKSRFVRESGRWFYVDGD